MIKIICPISSDLSLTKQTKKSIDSLRCDKIVAYPKGAEIGTQMCREIDLSCEEHLFVNSDIAFTENDLNILRKSGVDVVSGAYTKSIKDGNIHGNQSWFSGEETGFVAGRWGSQPGLIGCMIDSDCLGMIKVDWTGDGFLYCKTPALQKIIDLKEEPVFYYQTIKTAAAKFGIGQTSADLGFALNCKKAGISMWINCAARVQHIRRRK